MLSRVRQYAQLIPNAGKKKHLQKIRNLQFSAQNEETHL